MSEQSVISSLLRCASSLAVSLMLLGLVLLLSIGEASADPFFNSSEPGCDGSDPTILFCDDFEDGDWAQSNCDFLGGKNYSGNDGWCMTIYYPNLGGGSANGTNGAGFNPPAVPGYAVCSGKGAVGTNCAATSAARSGSSGMMGSHNLNGGPYLEVYYRVYFKNLPGYVPGHEKMFGLTTNAGTNYLLQMSYNTFGSNVMRSIPIQNQDLNPGGWQVQNQGNALTLQNNHWYYLEQHIKLNTLGQANGVYEMWLDDCGTSGTGCTGAGTLRSRYTALQYRTSGDQDPNALIGAFWLENWSNPQSTGETHYDQMVVATRRIGPLGANFLSPPTNLRVQ